MGSSRAIGAGTGTGSGTDGTDSTQALGFALSFIGGKGLLSVRDRKLGPLDLTLLELEIPRIAFPFDVTGGAERFKSHHCTLRHLVFGIDADTLNEQLARAVMAGQGFSQLKAAVREGFLELAGRFGIGEHQADFTMRVAFLLRSPSEMAVVFFDPRVYGWLPVPAALLPVYLRRALNLPYVGGDWASLWTLSPGVQLMRELLPRFGWKIPDSSDVSLVGVDCSAKKLTVVVGPEGELSKRQLVDRSAPTAAVRAAEGVAHFGDAERALFSGDILGAYLRYREALEDERGGPWAKERLLQIGAADPQLGVETRQLAEEILAQDPNDTQALLALAAIARRDEQWEESARRYAALAEWARGHKERLDAVAAELAAAEAATPIDPGGALAAYERAAARARDSVAAHQALFKLRGAQGDWPGAVLAAEKLIKLETDPAARARLHRELGVICRDQMKDLKRARSHFERALKIIPDDPAALEGLAETFAARGEPARAAAYLARLAEHAEASGDKQRIIELNMRLGEIWERWLTDPASAAARYRRVLDIQPGHRAAKLRLAELAEARGDAKEARNLYEDILAAEEDSADPEAVADLVAAYIRLARVTVSGEGSVVDAIACLERAVDLDPKNRQARDELAKLLRRQNEWGRLFFLLRDALQSGLSAEDARAVRLELASLELEQGRDSRTAAELLDAILAEAPADANALALYLPLLERDGRANDIARLLAAAAAEAGAPERRAELLVSLSEARRKLDQGIDAQARPLEEALEAHPLHRGAAHRLVELLGVTADHERLATALGRLAYASADTEERLTALLRQAEVLATKLGRAKDAERVLFDAIALDRQRLPAWLAVAALLETQGDPAGARAVLLDALRAQAPGSPNLATLEAKLAELARRRDDVDAEAEHLERAIEAGLRDDAAITRLLQALAMAGRLEKTARLLVAWAERGDLRDPQKLRLQAADIYRGLGDTDRAAALYQELAALGGDVALLASLALERIAQDHNDHEGAAAAIELQLRLVPNTEVVPILERLLAARRSQNRLELAREVAQRLLAQVSGNMPARRMLAEIAMQDSDYLRALEHLTKVVLRAPLPGENVDARLECFADAAALAHELRPSLVDELRQRLRDEAPQTADDALDESLSQRLGQRGQWEAVLALRRAQLELALRTSDTARQVELRFDLGLILHEHLGRPAEAVPHLEAVLREKQADAALAQRAERAFVALGRANEAAALFAQLAREAKEPALAQSLTLRAARLWTEELGDRPSAQAALALLLERSDLDLGAAEWLDSLRRLRLDDTLIASLSRTLDEATSFAPEHLVELVTLLSSANKEAIAVAFSERLAVRFPEEDTPWRQWVDVLDNIAPGDVDRVLRAWAAARSGAARAAILAELADRQEGGDDTAGALATLMEAAEAHTKSVPILRRVIGLLETLDRWADVVAWRRRLLSVLSVAEEKSTELRAIASAVIDHELLASLAIDALAELSDRSDAETATLARLYLSEGEVVALADLAGARDVLGLEDLIRAGAAFAEASRLEDARAFFETALARADDIWPVWDAIAAAWLVAGKQLELGAWRIAAGRRQDGPAGARLELRGYLDRLEAGGETEPEAHGVDFESAASSLDLSDDGQAFLLFEAAQRAGKGAWRDKAARLLEARLPGADRRLPAVLRARCEDELNAKRLEPATEIAKRLVDLGDPSGDDLLVRALEAAGRLDELIGVLTQRAEQGGAEAPQLWMRIAGLWSRRQVWDEAAQALARVESDARDLAWGELQVHVGEALADPRACLAGAAMCREHAASDAERVRWLRYGGRLLWWELGDAVTGQGWLAEAQSLAALTGAEFLAAARDAAGAATASDRDAAAARVLEEGVLLVEEADSAALRIALATILRGQGDEQRAAELLESSVRHMPRGPTPENALLWGDLGRQATLVGAETLAVTALAEAYGRDPDANEKDWFAALERAQSWQRLAEVLTSRAESLPRDAAASRYAYAGRIYRDQLGDKEKALDRFARASRGAPILSNLGAAFALARELDKRSVLGAMGGKYLSLLAEDAAERGPALRVFVDALDHLQLEHDTGPWREALIARGEANARDYFVSGSLLTEEKPDVALERLEKAAQLATGADRAHYLCVTARQYNVRGQLPEARAFLSEAFEAGCDELEAHQLAYTILEGSSRSDAAERVYQRQGDAAWSAAERSTLRCELAAARRLAGDLTTALGLLDEAAPMAKTAAWIRERELVLEGLGMQAEVAALWLEQARSREPAFSGDELVERLRRAADVYGTAGDRAAEIDALDQILARLPQDVGAQQRLAEAAADLGDRDRLEAVARQQIAAASDATERGRLSLRYAEVLATRLDAADLAYTLIEEAFTDGPSEELAQALVRYGELRAMPKEALADILVAGADGLQGVARAAVLFRAGALLQDSGADATRRLAVFGEAHAAAPDHTESRDLARAAAEELGRWDEVIAIAERSATVAEGGAAATSLIEAADIARDQLESGEEEARLLALAIGKTPGRGPIGVRLAERLLALGRAAQAAQVVVAGNVERPAEVELGSRLIDALRRAGDAEAAQALLAYVGANHPQSLVASDFRIDQARAAGDETQLFDELEARLAHPAMFDDDERRHIHLEAGRVALRLGRDAEALTHLTDSFGKAPSDPNDLLAAGVLAVRLGDEGRLVPLVQRSVDRRGELEALLADREGGERVFGMSFVGLVHGTFGDEDAAMSSHAQAVLEAETAPPLASIVALRDLYGKRNAWQEMVGLLARLIDKSSDDKSRAQLLYEKATLLRDRLVDERRAMDTLQETLRADPNHGKAQRDLGLLLALRGDLGEALPLLERQVRLDDPNTPVEHLLAYLECIRHVGEHTRVFDVTAAVLRVAPGRVDMHALNAEALEGLGRFDHAEREWQRYVDMLGPTGPADEVATIRRRLAKNALQRDDIHAAVAQLEEAQRAKPDSLEIIAELRDLYEKASRWEDAASLRMREVASSSTAAEKLGHLAALAELYRDRLGDPGRAASMLEAMLAIAPDDVGVLRHLFATQSAAGDFAKVLVAGERLIAIVPEADLDATTLALMARAYDETGADPRLAAQFYTRATAKDPSNAALQARRRELAKAAGDFATYAAVEEATVEQAASEDEKIQRLQDLADIYLKRLGRAKDASTTLERALAIRPDDPAILRRLADATAADPSGYEKAAALYRKLSSQDPLAPDILRILARLYGQAGDTDRAYGHYAALLALAPTDTEAKNFVEACRRARPPAPQRALTDADRMRGLIHPEQSGPIEQLFAPLARFAELAHPGDLTRRGVSERDVLSPTDEKLRQLKDVLEPLGLAQAQVYLWRGGGYACEVELIGRPAMLLGSSLESDENARYRAFLVARTAEIYRTGHTLCTTLSDAELTALLAALCLAVEPAAKPPGVNAQTPNWTAIIGKRMTDPIRAALAPAVLGYLAAAQDANLGAWRRAALSTGSRVAMLVACDIAEAIDAMLRLRGFDYIPDDQRPAVLRESPEELDLLLFSLSDVYFALRQSLGLALRRSK